MHLVRSIVIIALALFATTSAGLAQSPYDYPWCALYPWTSGATSCYYRSYQQCMDTVSGIGGFCIHSPYYRGPGPAPGPRPRDLGQRPQ